MARRMVVVPEEFLKVFRQEPQIPLNMLRNDELLADRLNKALNQRAAANSETKTASTQTQPSDNDLDMTPNAVNQPGINQTPATPTDAFPVRAPELATPTEFQTVVTTPRRRRGTSPLEQRQKLLRHKLRRVTAWDSTTKEVYNWEGGRIEHSNIDDILSYAFDSEGREPPLGYKAIARHLKIMNETGFPNKDFERVVDQSTGVSPVTVRRKTRTPHVTQRGKGGCCKKKQSGKGAEPLRWTPY